MGYTHGDSQLGALMDETLDVGERRLLYVPSDDGPGNSDNRANGITVANAFQGWRWWANRDHADVDGPWLLAMPRSWLTSLDR